MRCSGTLSALLLFSFFLLSAFRLSAQHLLQGTVRDAQGKAIDFATVVLQRQADSSVLQTAMTAADGTSSFSVPAPDHLLVKVLAPGYGTQVQLLNDTLPAIITMNMVLQARSRELDEVTVTGRKPLLERRVDRTVFNVENSISSTGGTALDALKKAPGVRVSSSDISIAGKSSVSVMIDDRLQQMSGDELQSLLKSIPAADVSRIEIITAPPAKYDAAGNSGIINIVTKKNRREGLNGTLEGGYERGRGNHVFTYDNFNYRKGKWNVYGNCNYYQGQSLPVEQYTTLYPGQQWEQRNDKQNQNIFSRNQLGADYRIGERSVIGVLYTLGLGGPQWNGDEDIRARIYNSGGGIDSMVNTVAHMQDRGLRNVGNLNYEWKIDTNGKKLSADLDYFTRTGNKQRDFSTVDLLSDGSLTGPEQTNRISGRQVIDIRSGKLDVEWPSRLAQLGFGGKVSFIHNTSVNRFELVDNGVYITDPARTNTFDYRENTQALYGNARQQWGKWQAQLGLRGEYTQTQGYSPTLGQTNTNQYFKLFPTVFLQYVPAKDQVLNINYSRRIDRPDFWVLNPFRSYTTDVSYEEGNPFLQPSFSHNIELGYTLNSNYTFTLYTQQVRHYFTRVSVVDTASQALIFRQANAGNMANYGFTCTVAFDPFPWWEGNVQFNGYYSEFTSTYYGTGFRYSKPTCYLETSNSFTCNKAKTLLAELGFWFQAGQQDDFDYRPASCNLSAAVKVLLWNKRCTLAVAGDDLLRTDRFRVRNQYNGTRQDSYYDERCVNISLSYKFGNRNVQAKRERSSSSEEESRVK